MFLGDSLISQENKKQIAAYPSAEVKYRATTTAEIVWLYQLLADPSVLLSALTPMYCDKKISIKIAHYSVYPERTKHIEFDCHLVY